MNTYNRRAVVVTSVILALTVFGLAGAAVHQRIASSRIRGEIADQQGLLAQCKGQSSKCVDSQGNYKECSLKLGGRFPKCSWTEQMPFMLSQVEGIATPLGLKIDTLQPQPMTSARNILRFPVRIALQADLTSVTRLLEDFERTSPLLEVDRLDLRNADGKSGKLQVDMTLSSFVVLDANAPVSKRRALRAAKAPTPQPEDSVATLKPKTPGASPQTASFAAGTPVPSPIRGHAVPVAQGPGPIPNTMSHARFAPNGGRK
jgi:hypothetical protein